MAFSAETRRIMIERLAREELDILIIGGGITGAGVALQASAAGIKTGLIEMQDFGEGTSSRSTKLVHGGLRYLKNFDVEVVSDTVTERAIVQSIAPHIPKPVSMLLPIYNEPSSTFNLFSVKVAMDLYDQLANVTGSSYANYCLTPTEVLEREPSLRKEGLLGGGVYLDYKNNDARLVIENIKQANADGGLIVNRVEAVGFLYQSNGQIKGVTAKDRLTGQLFEIRAKLVINTGGPWVDKIRQLSVVEALPPKIRPTKGVHLVIDNQRLKVQQPTYLDTGKGDGRMFFVVPRKNKTYFGTTDTDYQGEFAQPKVQQADVDYLLECLNYRYPNAQITLADIEASWVGLRPLISTNGASDYNGGSNGKISDASFEQVLEIVQQFQQKEVDRYAVEAVLTNLESQLSENQANPSAVSRGSELTRDVDGLLTLAGGKITDYRKMAEGALNLIQAILAKEFNLNYQLIDSKRYQVSGGKFNPQAVEVELKKLMKLGLDVGLSELEAITLAELYGSNTPVVLAKSKEWSGYDGLSLGESLGLSYAMEHEMVLTPADYLVRRTDHLLFSRETLDRIKEPIISAMGTHFRWGSQEQIKQRATLEQVIAESDLRELKGPL